MTYWLVLLCTLTAKSRLTVKALPWSALLFAGCFLVAADVDVGVAVAVIAAVVVVAAALVVVVVVLALFVVVFLLSHTQSALSRIQAEEFSSATCSFSYVCIYLCEFVCV